MTQVYSFVDENGVTRLFAEIHPDPAGTPFNGGTITEPLAIDTDATGVMLDVNDTTLNNWRVNVRKNDNGGGSLDAIINARGEGSGSAGVDLNNGAGTTEVRLNTDIGLLIDSALNVGGSGLVDVSSNYWGALFQVFTDSLAVNAPCRFQSPGPAILANNSAPSDGTLAAGECALWFDSTNGAAKLMIKAKQADGTVKTGFVAVVT